MSADNSKLYVGNLAFKCTKDDLVALFSQHGDVTDAVIITDKLSGRSRGFGFVTMASDDQAQAAIDALNDAEFQERKLTVNVARPPKNDHRN